MRFRDKTLLVGIISALAIWFVWAAIDPLPIIEDEYSYVLQSRIFATFHWTAPSPPAPEFFQQSHVLTIPAVASKYPPGHALLLSLGSVFGAPALVPLLLTGLTAALMFVLVCRITNVWTAALSWLVWLGDPINLRFRAAYYSEVTTSALWLVSWWALFRWRRDRRRHWLLVLAAAIGWGAITRPLTTLAFAVPVGVVVIRDVIRLKLWRDFGLAAGLGTAILGILPLWSAETTGNWRQSPLALYTHDYLPYDKPGFGVDTTPPARTLQPVNKETYFGFYDEHLKHTPANLPHIALERLSVIAHDEWSGYRLVLVPFVVIGLFAMNAEAAFVLVCSLALFVAYLSYGHWSHWTLYYFEAMPALSLLAGLGLWRVIDWVRVRGRIERLVPLGVAVCALVAALTATELGIWRGKRRQMAEWDVAIRALIAKLPMPAAVVFVHYAPRIGPHARIVTNSPHLDDDPVWIVNDLGSRDPELMRFAGARIPLVFQEDAGTFEIDRRLLRPSP